MCFTTLSVSFIEHTHHSFDKAWTHNLPLCYVPFGGFYAFLLYTKYIINKEKSLSWFIARLVI